MERYMNSVVNNFFSGSVKVVVSFLFKTCHFYIILYFCNRMQRSGNILPLNRLFLNIKKRDEFNF